jgi:hypothetical protein
LAIGCRVIRCVTIQGASIKRLRIGELEADRLRIKE